MTDEKRTKETAATTKAEPVFLVQNRDAKPVCKIGDILKPFSSWEGDDTKTGGGWYSKPPEEVWEDKPFLRLGFLAYNTWVALERLAIDLQCTFRQMVAYKCPFSDNRYYWFVPCAVFTDNVEWWVDRVEGSIQLGRDYALDVEWQRNVFNGCRQRTHPGGCNPILAKTFPLSDIDKAFLGHGYTDFTYPNDGDGHLHPAVVSLSNGDYLGGTVWVWYNK